MWWHEHSADGWQTHKISDACSQTHALEFADLNGDAVPDYITGKRWWSHGKNEPGADKPVADVWNLLGNGVVI